MRDLFVNLVYFGTFCTLSYLTFYASTHHLTAGLLSIDKNYITGFDFRSPRLQHCLMIVLVSFVFHCVVHFCARCLYRTFLERYYTLPFPSRITLSEKVLSSIHGFVLGTVGLNLVIVKQVWRDDIFGQYPLILDYAFCFSCGYELYDLGTMIMQDIQVPRYNENVFWIHHTSMLIGYTIAMYKKKMAFVAAVMMITELTVLPSNAHWYLKAFLKQDTRAFHFNQGLRMWSFVILRLCTAPIIIAAFCINFNHFLQEDFVTQLAAVVITTILGFMNVSWTQQMIALYRKRTRLRDKRARLQIQKTPEKTE